MAEELNETAAEEVPKPTPLPADKSERKIPLPLIAGGSVFLCICLVVVFGAGIFFGRTTLSGNLFSRDTDVDQVTVSSDPSESGEVPLPTTSDETMGTTPAETQSAEQTEGAGQPTLPPPSSTSPSGTIIYTCFDGTYDQLCTISADGSGQTQLTSEPATDWYGSIGTVSNQIVLSSLRNGFFEIYTLTDGTATRLTQNFGENYAPEFSPDGTLIAFSSNVNGRRDIFVITLDGSEGIRQITTDTFDDTDPTWSPDGTQIAFTSNRTGDNEIFVINLDGAGERQVTSGSTEGGRIDWSPDGTVIGFHAGERGDLNLFTVPVGCESCGPEAYTQLTFGGNNKAPSFSPDGNWITFASELDGDNEIFIMSADGTQWIQLTDNDLADWQPRWGP